MKRSSFRGVTIERGRWKAQIGYSGKTHHIGTYDTDVEAAKAYDKEARRVNGKKALCNFPVVALSNSTQNKTDTLLIKNLTFFSSSK